MAVNTGQPFCNTTDGYLCEGTDVKGSYFVIDEIKNIPNKIAKIGSLCFCTSDSKFYQYQITSEPNAEKVTYGWVEVKFEADLQDYAKTQDIIDGNIIAGKAEKDGNGNVIHNTYQTKITETNKLDYKYIKNLPESSGITQGQLDDQLKAYQTKNLSSPITINGQAESTVEGAIEELNTQKVNVVKGKGLSTNDLTNELLEQLQDKYTKNEINTNYYNINQITPLLNDKANTNDLKALAYKDSITKQDIGLGNVNNVAITQEQVNQIGTNKQSIENINTANITRDQNISNAQVTANEAKLIAEGKSRTSVFETLEALKTSLKNADATQFRLGDNLYIKATDVPDYWISNVLDNNSGEYGYYQISPLETAKVDLSQYQPLITNDNKLSYNLLKDTPTIPTKLSELEQDIEIGGSDGVTEEDVMNIIEENSTEVATLNIGTSNNYDETSDTEIPTTKAVSEIIKKSTNSQKLMNYTLPLTEASWIRIAKVKDINKNSSGTFTLNCYGIDHENNKKIFTTSVFAVNCGYDSQGNLISDVLPITQIPELKGGASGGSDGGSSEEDTGSAIEEVSAISEEEIMVTSDEGGSDVGGSGASGSYGLASIKIENYLGEIYVCGLVNFPSTDKYSMLEVDMIIDNNLNYEYLETLEPVDLDEVNEDEQQVLEDYTLEKGKDYEWRISCNLQKYIDGLNAEKEINIRVESLERPEPLSVIYRPYYLEITGNGVEGFGSSVDSYPQDLVNFNFALEEEIELHPGHYSLGENLVEKMSKKIYAPIYSVGYTAEACATKISGSIRFEEAGQEIYLNGEKVFDSENGTYTFENLIVGVDTLVILGREDLYPYFTFNTQKTEIEIAIPVEAEATTRISQYTIANNDVYDFKLKIAELFKHETSESYDLFSVYDELNRLDTDVSAIRYDTNYIYNIVQYMYTINYFTFDYDCLGEQSHSMESFLVESIIKQSIANGITQLFSNELVFLNLRGASRFGDLLAFIESYVDENKAFVKIRSISNDLRFEDTIEFRYNGDISTLDLTQPLKYKKLVNTSNIEIALTSSETTDLPSFIEANNEEELNKIIIVETMRYIFQNPTNFTNIIDRQTKSQACIKYTAKIDDYGDSVYAQYTDVSEYITTKVTYNPRGSDYTDVNAEFELNGIKYGYRLTFAPTNFDFSSLTYEDITVTPLYATPEYVDEKVDNVVSEEQVMEIVINNAIKSNDTYTPDDNTIPTTKTVANMIDNSSPSLDYEELDKRYVNVTGDTIEDTVYMDVPEGSTPYLIGKDHKIGIRAQDENGDNVGQMSISDTYWDEFEGHLANVTARGDDGKHYSLYVSKKGPQYLDGATDTVHQLATEEKVSEIVQENINKGIPEIVVTGDVAERYDINPNNYYTFEGINNNNFIINLVGDTQGFVNEYKGQIYVDENPLAITFPSNVRWKADDNVSIDRNILTFNPKFTYLYSILNNIGIIMSIENEALATPVLTLTDSTISWDAVPNADYYDIYVNDELLTNTTATYIDLRLHLLEVAHYNVKVKATSNKYTDSISSVIIYTISKQLDAPTGLVLNDSGVLTWNTVENANRYKVYATPVGDVDTNTYLFYSGTNNYTDLMQNTNPSLTGKTCVIQVIAYNTENTAYLDSNPSESIEYTFHNSGGSAN